jgi:monovalent cation/hydrogen antiporter
MALFQLITALLLIGAILTAWGRRLNLPYPALLALAGAALALLPHAPRVELDPRLALVLFVAPVLLNTAFDTSPRDLGFYWRPIAALAIGAVIATVASVAVVTRWILPEVSWPVAIALGAIVAPSDATAATAVISQLRPPHRLLVVIEGESLFNDAGALLIYRFAVAAAVTGAFNGWTVVPIVLLETVGSVVLAAILAWLSLAILVRIEDVATSIIIQFLSTFAVWILADAIGLSGIITVVVYAILVARRAPAVMPARLRIPSYAVWDVAVFVLNVLAFILVGLQVRPILEHLSRFLLNRYWAAAAAICAAVILVRLVWIGGYAFVAKRLAPLRLNPRNPATQPPTWRGALLAGWCGMRGIVTLAAALALPDGANGTPAFPHRDFVIFAAFAVVLVTLVVQGLTVRPLLIALKLHDDGSVEREVWLARVATAQAALATLPPADGASDPHSPLRVQYELRARHAEYVARTGTHDADDDAQAERLIAERRRAQTAERRALVDLRANGAIGDDAFHRVEEELDWADLDLDGLAREE